MPKGSQILINKCLQILIYVVYFWNLPHIDPRKFFFYLVCLCFYFSVSFIFISLFFFNICLGHVVSLLHQTIPKCPLYWLSLWHSIQNAHTYAKYLTFRSNIQPLPWKGTKTDKLNIRPSLATPLSCTIFHISSSRMRRSQSPSAALHRN